MDRARGRLWWVTLFFIALGVSVGFVYQQLRGSDVQLAQGRKFYVIGQFDMAAKYFKRSTELDPKDADAWNGLGMSCKNLGRNADAADALGRATALKSNVPTWWIEYAQALEWSNQSAQAQHAWERAMALLPPDDERLTQARISVARSLAAQKQYDRAIESLNEMLAKKDDPQVRFALAEVLAWGGRFKESEREYRRAIDSQPENSK